MDFTEDDVGPKMVAGQEVELSPAEKRSIAADWNAVRAARLARDVPIDWRDLLDELQAKDPGLLDRLQALANARGL